MKRKLLLLILLPYLCLAQIPTYYNGIDFTKSGNELKTQLTNLISTTHTTILPYTVTNGPIDTWKVIKQSDLDPTNSANVLLIYGFNDIDGISSTDRTRSKDLSCHTSSCNGLWVREHTYPRSLGNPPLDSSTDPTPNTDVHHLRSIDSQRNNTRSNYPFGAGSGNSTLLGTSPQSFYPGDEWKGDAARIMMYMYTRYGTRCLATVVGTGAATFSSDMPNIFLQWNADDPVSQIEINKNNINNTYQGNRNPFIDNPFIAKMIWSGPDAENPWGLTLSNKNYTLTNVNVYPTITTNFVEIHKPEQKAINFKVYNTMGKELQIGSTTTNQTIDFTNYPTGLYFIHLEENGKFKVIKVIKN